MIQRLLAATAVVALLVLSQAPLRADIVQLEDGAYQPDEVQEAMRGVKSRPPGGVLGQSSKFRITSLTYKEAKVARKSWNAAEIKDLWTTRADQNGAFQDAEVQA